MNTPLFSHPATPPASPKPRPRPTARPRTLPQHRNPVTYAFRAKITVLTVDIATLAVKGVSFAGSHGVQISMRDHRLKYWSIRWLLSEGSNLAQLKALVKSPEAIYILERRTLRAISRQYPEMLQAVNALIRTDYNPEGRMPVCIAEPLGPLKAEMQKALKKGEQVSQEALLHEVLETQTDYSRLLDRTLYPEHQRALKASCLRTVAYAHAELFTIAMAEADKLAPRRNKSSRNPKKS